MPGETAGNLGHTIIRSRGMEIHCYGEWKEDSNCFCVFEDEEFDEFYCGEGEKNWTEVAKKLATYAAQNGTVLHELSSC